VLIIALKVDMKAFLIIHHKQAILEIPAESCRPTDLPESGVLNQKLLN